VSRRVRCVECSEDSRRRALSSRNGASRIPAATQNSTACQSWARLISRWVLRLGIATSTPWVEYLGRRGPDGWVGAWEGGFPDALVDALQAVGLDRLSPAIERELGRILLWSGDADGAQRELDGATRLEFGCAFTVQGKALIALGNEDAIDLQMALTEWAAVSGIPGSLAAELGSGMLAYLQAGAEQSIPHDRRLIPFWPYS
jgi:hypothetical protein